MVESVHIGANALFAAVVLSPEWGSQYQLAAGAARRERSAHVASRVGGVDGNAERATAERGSEQMALL
jgi:hypothetical protein